VSNAKKLAGVKANFVFNPLKPVKRSENRSDVIKFVDLDNSTSSGS